MRSWRCVGGISWGLKLVSVRLITRKIRGGVLQFAKFRLEFFLDTWHLLFRIGLVLKLHSCPFVDGPCVHASYFKFVSVREL